MGWQDQVEDIPLHRARPLTTRGGVVRAPQSSSDQAPALITRQTDREEAWDSHQKTTIYLPGHWVARVSGLPSLLISKPFLNTPKVNIPDKNQTNQQIHTNTKSLLERLCNDIFYFRKFPLNIVIDHQKHSQRIVILCACNIFLSPLYSQCVNNLQQKGIKHTSNCHQDYILQNQTKCYWFNSSKEGWFDFFTLYVLMHDNTHQFSPLQKVYHINSLYVGKHMLSTSFYSKITK